MTDKISKAQPEKEDQERLRCWATLEMNCENIKVLTGALHDLGQHGICYEPYGRKIILNICDAIKSALDEMEKADRKI